jgi:hypothetical protein
MAWNYNVWVPKINVNVETPCRKNVNKIKIKEKPVNKGGYNFLFCTKKIKDIKKQAFPQKPACLNSH